MKKLMTICALVTMILAVGAPALSFDINGHTVTYTAKNGYYGGTYIIADQSFTLSYGAVVEMNSTMANTGVQHFGFNLIISSVPYLSGSSYYSFKGLSFGHIILRRDRTTTSTYCIITLDAAAGNSAPTSYMNPEDLIMKFNFNSSLYYVGFAPGNYTFDFAFDYPNNTTTLNITGGTTASKTWSGTMSINCFDFVSQAWDYGTGSTLQVSNFVYGVVPEPCPSADLTGDCFVDMDDFALLASYWFSDDCVAPDWCGGADIDTSGNVWFDDLKELATQWLTEVGNL